MDIKDLIGLSPIILIAGIAIYGCFMDGDHNWYNRYRVTKTVDKLSEGHSKEIATWLRHTGLFLMYATASIGGLMIIGMFLAVAASFAVAIFDKL